MGGDTTPRSLFISHKDKDKDIADALRTTVNNWCVGQDVEVYQSSNPKASPVTVGRKIKDDLKRAISDVDVVLLIYTDDKDDWSFCMWECGLATNPRANAADPDANIVVLQCLNSIPAVFEDQLWVPVNEEGIEKLTSDFHNSPDFFSRHDGAFLPADKDTIRERSFALLQKLQKAIRPLRDRTEHKRGFTPQWIRIHVSLSLSKDQLDLINRTRDPEKSFELTEEVIKSKCVINEKTDTHAFGHFDLAGAKRGLTLWEFYKSWQFSEAGQKFKHMNWFRDLGVAMIRRILNKQALEAQVPVKSAKEQQTWYLPVINAFRSENNDCDWEFLIELYRIPEQGEYLKIVSNEP